MLIALFSEIFSVIAPVFIIAGLGFWWVKAGYVFDTPQLTPLIVNVATPCLIISTLTEVEIPSSVLSETALAAALVILLCALVAAIAMKLAGLEIRTYAPPLVFGNVGNIGLPLALFAFGDEGLAYAIAVFTVYALFQFTVGQMVLSGKMSWREFIRMPILYGVAIALAFMLTDTKPPEWASNTLALFGTCVVPLMIFMLGVSLARLKITSLSRSVALGAFRLVLGMGVGLAVAELLDLEGVARGVLIIEAAMPVAVFNYLFAERYNRNAEEVAGMIVASTAMGFAMLPVILYIAGVRG